jgi:hypothetical protein
MPAARKTPGTVAMESRPGSQAERSASGNRNDAEGLCALRAFRGPISRSPASLLCESVLYLINVNKKPAVKSRAQSAITSRQKRAGPTLTGNPARGARDWRDGSGSPRQSHTRRRPARNKVDRRRRGRDQRVSPGSSNQRLLCCPTEVDIERGPGVKCNDLLGSNLPCISRL